MRRPALLPSVMVLIGGLSPASGGGTPASEGAAPARTGGLSAGVAVPAPLSAEVRQAVVGGRLSADAAVARYWTAERMRAADAVPLVRPMAGSPLLPRASPGVPLEPSSGTMERSPSSTGSTRADQEAGPGGGTGGPASRTVGKVFYRSAANGRDYSCSAAVVNSTSKNLLSTAGHCVYDGRGAWHQNWAFVPRFDRGRKPYGIWRAAWLVTFTGWALRKESGLDVAFVKVASAGGDSLVDLVGGNGIRTGFSERRRRLTIVGYPFLPPYSGDRQYQCRGVTVPAGHRLRMSCRLTTGASGGPWLEAYDATTGLGYIDGVTTNTDLANTTLWSPYFDDGVWALYRWADNL